MKAISLLGAALFAGSALAQTAASNPGQMHMLEFNADSVLQSVLSFDKSKTRGSDADNDTQLDLNVGYAYTFLPRLQLGGRLNYNKGTEGGRGDFEDYGLEVGMIANHYSDLQNTCYASLYLGYELANTYGSNALDRKDETTSLTAAIGRRFSMERWGIKHLTYTPEVAFQTTNSTTGSALEYSQNLQLRILQFSVLF